MCGNQSTNGLVSWSGARFSRAAKVFAPLIFFPADAGSRRAFPRGGNVRRETKAPCLVLQLCNTAQKKSREIRFSEYGYFVQSPAVVKMQKVD